MTTAPTAMVVGVITLGTRRVALSLWLKYERSTANSCPDGRGKQDKWSPHISSSKRKDVRKSAWQIGLPLKREEQVQRPGWIAGLRTTETPWGPPAPLGGEEELSPTQ